MLCYNLPLVLFVLVQMAGEARSVCLHGGRCGDAPDILRGQLWPHEPQLQAKSSEDHIIYALRLIIDNVIGITL